MSEFPELEERAKNGDAEAQYDLGINIMEHDIPRSRSWLLAAAEQDHAAACMSLCYLEIEFGLGEVEGLKWYRRARELGHPHDPSNLLIWGPMVKYFTGIFEDVVSKTKCRAMQGDPDDQYRMGCWYVEGEPPFHRNFIRAYAWFVVASNSPPQDTRAV